MLKNLVFLPLIKRDCMAFPSPAKDYQEEVIDLSKELVRRPSSTFYFRVTGDSMINACIPENALLVIDRSITPVSGMIIVAVLGGEFTVRRLLRVNRYWVLHPENPLYKPVKVTKDMDFFVWGVVTAIVIQPYKG